MRNVTLQKLRDRDDAAWKQVMEYANRILRLKALAQDMPLTKTEDIVPQVLAHLLNLILADQLYAHYSRLAEKLEHLSEDQKIASIVRHAVSAEVSSYVISVRRSPVETSIPIDDIANERDAGQIGAENSPALEQALKDEIASTLQKAISSLSRAEAELLHEFARGRSISEMASEKGQAFEQFSHALKHAQIEIRAHFERSQITVDDLIKSDIDLAKELETRLKPDASPPPPVADDQVRFSAFYPRSLAPGASAIINVWAYLDSQRDSVLQRAQRRADTIEGAEVGPVPVRQESQLTLTLWIDGLTCEKPTSRLYWNGVPSITSFCVRVPQDTEQQTRVGQITISDGNFPIAVLHLELNIAIKANHAEHEAMSRNVRRIFASYANADRLQVTDWTRGASIAGAEVFLDVLIMREGEDWETRLWQEVPSRDLFCLFWSQAAKASHWVEKEWRCALKARGAAYVHPVPLEDPRDVPPPPELAEKHFFDTMLALYLYERGRMARTSSND